ncbi:MAG: GH74 [uncultured Thermomicrobiales bacterium]|uniref:GH74 n=1 Tax=uncultured Thermomicrobiales bacterium TaxID=1645740 RepID=A0A6J4UN43_9BACT|nr:MAG: GH74 [uncultured Thermomicrobiales bacterium]
MVVTMLELFGVVGGGLVRLRNEGDDWRADLLRADERAQCLALDPRDPAVIYLGTLGGGVWRSADGGGTWEDLRLPETDVFSLAVGPVDGALYAGTEPSRLFRSDDGGATWREPAVLRDLPSAPTWSFPPRPWTSHVRWIAPHPSEAGLLLVGIELGGVLRSEDGGATWEDQRPGAEADAHALAWHPCDPERAYEAGGGGAALSRDGGQTWDRADDGRDRHYTWGLAVSPDEPDTWFVSATFSARQAHSGGDAQARLYRRRGSAPWEPLRGGLPDPLDGFPYALLAAGGRIVAGLGDGRLFASRDGGDTWAEAVVRGASLRGLKALASR